MRSARPRRRAGAAGALPPRATSAGRLPGRRLGGPVLALLLAAVLTGCGGDTPSMLDPRSDDARRVEGLWWVLFWISCAVVAVVTGFLLAAARRRRAEFHVDDQIDRRPVSWGDRFVVIAGAAVPGGILAGTFAFSLVVLNDMGSGDRNLEIEVEGHTWWWEVRYPNGAVTANEIRIPVGETVELALPTADVIHSFWVPELQVKKDHIPGADNRLSVVADHAGRFRGQCAEFCGLQHAHMEIMVEALPADEFDDWLRREARPAPEPEGADAEEGRRIFERASCAGCHTIRGTSAAGTLGPDLTHVANRDTLGAGAVPFTPEALDDFITDPQHDKPGVSMPPTELTPDQVDAVVAYLTELE